MMTPKPMKADWNEILFEGREIRYGAYPLRKAYTKRLMKACSLTLLLFLLGVSIPAIINHCQADESPTIEEDRIVTIVDIIMPPLPEEPEIIPPTPPLPELEEPKVQITRHLLPEPTPEEELLEEEEEMESNEKLETSVPGLVTQTGSDEFWLSLEGEAEGLSFEQQIVTNPKPIDDEPKVGDVVIVSKEPETINLDNLKKAIGYPEIARENGIEGMVVLRVLVDEKGYYVKHKAIKNPNVLLTKACEKEIAKLRFTPALQGQKPIKFWVNVPFRFRLNE